MATTQTNEERIFNLEKQFWQAIKDKDIAAAKRLTDFPCILGGPQGVDRVDEAAFTAMMSDARYTLDDFDLGRDAKVRMLGDDVAVRVTALARSAPLCSGSIASCESPACPRHTSRCTACARSACRGSLAARTPREVQVPARGR